MSYLTHTDDHAFEGLTKKEPKPGLYGGLVHECPKCRGFGGWVLTPDAYGAGRHFQASCMDCNGWGFVSTATDHPHEWDNGVTIGNCLNRYTCRVCGNTLEVDSSD